MLHDPNRFAQDPSAPSGRFDARTALARIDSDRAIAIAMQLDAGQHTLLLQAAQHALGTTGGLQRQYADARVLSTLIQLGLVTDGQHECQLTPFGASVLLGVVIDLAMRMGGIRA